MIRSLFLSFYASLLFVGILSSSNPPGNNFQQPLDKFPEEITSHIYVVNRKLTEKDGTPFKHDILMYLPPRDSRKLFDIITADQVAALSNLFNRKLRSHGMFSAALWSQYVIPLWREEIQPTAELLQNISAVADLDKNAFPAFYYNLWAVDRIVNSKKLRSKKGESHGKIQIFLKQLGIDYKRCNRFHPNMRSNVAKNLNFQESQVPSIFRAAQHWGYDILEIAELTKDKFEISKQITEGNIPAFLAENAPMDPIDANFTAHWEDAHPYKYTDHTIKLDRDLWLTGKLDRKSESNRINEFKISDRPALTSIYFTTSDKTAREKKWKVTNENLSNKQTAQHLSGLEQLRILYQQPNNAYSWNHSNTSPNFMTQPSYGSIASSTPNLQKKTPRNDVSYSQSQFTPIQQENGAFKRRKLEHSFASSLGNFKENQENHIVYDHRIGTANYASSQNYHQSQSEESVSLENQNYFLKSASPSPFTPISSSSEKTRLVATSDNNFTDDEHILVNQAYSACLENPVFCDFMIDSLSSLNS